LRYTINFEIINHFHLVAILRHHGCRAIISIPDVAFLTLRHRWRVIFSSKRSSPPRAILSLSWPFSPPSSSYPCACYIKDSTTIVVVDDDRSLSLLPATRNAAAMPLNEHSTHSIPPFCPLSTSSATRKNVSWCAWRFIKFELQHGIESHRRRRNRSSNELEKPFLERWRKWMRRAKSRKKKKRTGWEPCLSWIVIPQIASGPSRDIRLRSGTIPDYAYVPQFFTKGSSIG